METVAGQPLGYLSSWPLFALTHHIYIDMAVCRTGEKFTKYAVLGDDVVIADQEVARVYEQSLDQCWVPIFFSKILNFQ